jgi:transmembrane sensor
MGKRETANEIEEAAFRWVALLDREGDDPKLLSDLTDWLAEDSRHEGAYLRAQALWLKLDRAANATAEDLPEPPLVTRRSMLAAGAGAAIAAAGAGAWILSGGKSFDTEIGEIRHVPLPDGSVADLNTSSEVRVTMAKSLRRVRLAEGEAWFHVESDPSRPFVVEAGLARVRAVGTAFSVRRLDYGAEVLVSEGIVEAWLSGAEIAAVRLVAGEKALLREGAPIQHEVAAPNEIDRKLAWRNGKIDLAGETLGEAVAEFNRYNQKEMLVKQQSLLSKRFYGVFRTDDPEGFAKAVHSSLSVPIDITKDSIVIGR